MKNKIIIGLTLFSLIFFIGGIYIITTIESATSKLDNLITLHQVEILREHLLLHIKRVQSDINLKNTRFARNINTVIANVKNMEEMADTCFDCHHKEDVQRRLDNLRTDVEKYKKLVSRIFTIRANVQRFQQEEDSAFAKGEELVADVNAMIRLATIKLESKTQSSLIEIAQTKKVLYILVATVPFLAGILGFVFIRGFTNPVNLLLKATRQLESGNLDYKIEGLTEEFGEVARSFNIMASSLKENMHKIEENEKRYRTLFESAGDAIFMVDMEGDNVGQIVSANPAAAAMHGYTVDEILKLNLIKDLDTAESAREAPERLKRIMNGERVNAEIMHRRKDGTTFPIEISAGLLEFMGHKYILAIDRDISKRKEYEENFERAEQMRLVGEWAASLAHEIKNSLAGIKISVEVLTQDPNVSDDDKTMIVRALDEIKRIESLLKSLLSFAKPPKLDLLGTNINEVLENAISFSLMQPSRSHDKTSKIKVVKDYANDLPETLTDNLQMRQVFMNIIINATEAMEGGGTFTARTSYDANANSILIEISDSGNGIDEKIANMIFHPFFTTKSKGTGLGLAISKRIIEQHGGDIYVANKPGTGAVFHINLPVKPVKKELIT